MCNLDAPQCNRRAVTALYPIPFSLYFAQSKRFLILSSHTNFCSLLFTEGLTTGSSGISKATSSKCVSAEKCAVQVMPYVETSDHFVTGEIAGKVEGNDDIEEEWKTTASADTKLDEEIIYCDRHTQDNDAKNIAETLIELSNTKHTSAVKKTRGCPTNTGTGNERKLMKSAHHSEHSHNEYDIVNETQKQRNRDEYTTEIAETLIGMKTIDSPPVLTKVPYESPTKAAQTCNNQRGSERSDVTWNRRLIELRQFKELHGHTNGKINVVFRNPQCLFLHYDLDFAFAQNSSAEIREKSKFGQLGCSKPAVYAPMGRRSQQLFSLSSCENEGAQRSRTCVWHWQGPFACLNSLILRSLANLKSGELYIIAGKGGFGRTTGVFLSSRNARDWENQFQCLREYRAMFGNCDVPVKSETHRSV